MHFNVKFANIEFSNEITRKLKLGQGNIKNVLGPPKIFKISMAQQYMPKIFHDPCKKDLIDSETPTFQQCRF